MRFVPALIVRGENTIYALGERKSANKAKSERYPISPVVRFGGTGRAARASRPQTLRAKFCGV